MGETKTMVVLTKHYLKLNREKTRVNISSYRKLYQNDFNQACYVLRMKTFLAPSMNKLISLKPTFLNKIS